VLLVIDNYDSFVYNLVQYLGALGTTPKVVRNNKIQFDEIEKMCPRGIVISPGPGNPEGAGMCLEIIRRFSGKIPILGVCLGHQCIGTVFGARISMARELVHGKTSVIHHQGLGILDGISQGINVARYHSLILDKDSIPEELLITAVSEDGTVMAVQHKTHATFGVQFHPESLASEYGMEILGNFIKMI
jgi:anthranilate synthase/aminodeoxychorismate synthase-like glutamine amidotransferase